MRTKPNEKQLVAQACRLRANGISYWEISKKLRVQYNWIRRRLDPGYRAKLIAASRDYYGINIKPLCVTYRAAHKYGSSLPISEDRLRELRSNNPPDTRDLTARLLGDPLPWRSALAQKGGNNADPQLG